MKRITYALCTALAMLLCWNCCKSPDCNNVTGPPFTEEGLAWFPYAEGDTLYFRDTISQEVFYMTCTAFEFTRDTSFWDDSRCEMGGYLEIDHVIKLSLTSDFPHSENEPLQLILKGVNSEYRIFTEITLFKPSKKYFYTFLIDKQEEILISTRLTTVAGKANVSVDGVVYENTYAIFYKNDPDINPSPFYDTIYCNRDGFLKFISSQYRRVLERVE